MTKKLLFYTLCLLMFSFSSKISAKASDDPKNDTDKVSKTIITSSNNTAAFAADDVTVDCDEGPVDETICYEDDSMNEVTYTSTDSDGLLNLNINSGEVENSSDEFIVLDSDGSELYSGYGDDGDLSGLSFQSTGNSITIQVDADFSNSCDDSFNGIEPIDLTVACATCENPDFTIEADCDSDGQYMTADVEITDMGDADNLVITDDQGGNPIEVSETGTVEVGPYPLGTDIQITVENEDDSNCSVTKTFDSVSDCESGESEGGNSEGPAGSCDDIEPFCSDEGLEFPNSFEDPPGSDGGPDGPDYGCLGSTPNPAWYYMEVNEDGPIEIDIHQEDPNGTGLDVDFAMWGPYESTEEACAEVMDGDAPLQCSYSADYDETIGIGVTGGYMSGESTPPDAQAGEIYMVVITNYSGQEGHIEFSQANQGDNDSGSTNCDIVTGDSSILACYGEEVELETEFENNESFIWNKYNPQTDEYEFMGDDYLDQPSITVTEEGEYQLISYEGADPYEEYFEVVIAPELEPEDWEDSVSICGTDSLVLDASIDDTEGFGGMAYTWKDEEGETVGSGATYEATEAGTYTVDIIAAMLDGNGEESTETCELTLEVEVTDADLDFDIGEDQDFCGEESYTIEVNSDSDDIEDAEFQWIGEDEEGNEILNETTTDPQLTVTETGYYTVTVEADECVSSQTVRIGLYETPDLELEADNDLTALLQYCENEEDQPTHEITFTASISNADLEEVDLIWFRNGEEISDVEGDSYTVDYSETGDYDDEITVEAYVEDCFSEASLTTDIEITHYENPCKITEGISPGNQDGYNDYLDLTYLNDRSGIDEIIIFDRYGREIYQEKDYTNGWHGQNKDGKDVTTGTYYYVIKFKNEDEQYGNTHKGWIYVNQAIN